MTTYTTFSKQIKGNTFQVLVAAGKHSYVSVCKKTNNPFGGVIGKDFATFDKAAAAYKSPEMKVFLLQVEMGLIQPDSALVSE